MVKYFFMALNFYFKNEIKLSSVTPVKMDENPHKNDENRLLLHIIIIFNFDLANDKKQAIRKGSKFY